VVVVVLVVDVVLVVLVVEVSVVVLVVVVEVVLVGVLPESRMLSKPRLAVMPMPYHDCPSKGP
jgi:hypothetical protein